MSIAWGVAPEQVTPEALPYAPQLEASLSELKRPKVIVKEVGGNNKICVDWESVDITFDMLIEVNGSGNTIYIGRQAKVAKLRISIQGSDNVVGIGEKSYFGNNRLQIAGHKCAIITGRGVGMQTNTYLLAKENGCKITIGDDCMFSTDIVIRTSDNHPVFDMKTKDRINQGKDVVIGDRVWIGENSKIMKGVNLSNDVVVAAASVVTKDAPPNTIVAGVPAKVVKTGVFWYRHFKLPDNYDPYNPTPWPL